MRKWILKLAVQHLLKVVTIDELLRIEGGKVFINDIELSDEEIGTLKGEALMFEKTMLWTLIVKNLYWNANFKMMKEANQEIEMVNGRMMTLCIATIEEFVDKLKEMK